MDIQQLRLEALRLAYREGDSHDVILKRAKKYVEFLTSGKLEEDAA